MAQNLEVEIHEGEAPLIPENPTPWQVQMRWFDMVDVNGDGELSRQEVRSWSVDAPSELVARTIKSALLNLSDGIYEDIMVSGYQV